MRKIIFPVLLIGIFCIYSCNNTKENETPTADSLKKDEKGLSDSTAIMDNPNFELKTNISSKTAKEITLVLEDGKTVPLNKFPQYYDNDGGGELISLEENITDSAIRCLVDIDHDNNPELITQYFSGGAHCCDVSDIFTKVSENTYKRIGHYVGYISVDKNGLLLYFYEDLGYFNTCYACSIESEVKLPAEVPLAIKLELKNGAFAYAGKDDKLNEGVEANLKVLKARGIPKMQDEMDDGTRKAFAYYIVAYYFNTDRDLAKTKELFMKYYNNADKDKIWKELEEYCVTKTSDVKKKISFR